ncbi:MAG TPA: sulfur carrier protein ThiS [Bacteroidales bacterium]|nr:sulfur carrier protein ThiS [Bacteroidales bacterium]
MKITLNNREEIFTSDKLTIAEIMDLKKFTFSKIIVKLNDIFIEKEDYDKTFVKESDNLIILHLLAGG